MLNRNGNANPNPYPIAFKFDLHLSALLPVSTKLHSSLLITNSTMKTHHSIDSLLNGGVFLICRIFIQVFRCFYSDIVSAFSQF